VTALQRPPNQRVARANSYRLQVTIEPTLRSHLAGDTVLSGAALEALRDRGERPASWIRLSWLDTSDAPNYGWRKLWATSRTEEVPWVSDSLLRASLRMSDVTVELESAPAASEMLKIVSGDLSDRVINRLSSLERAIVSGTQYGFLQTDAQKVADPGSSISFSITALPSDSIHVPLPRTVEVTFEGNPKIDYARHSITLVPRVPARVSARLKGKGLIPIMASSPGWVPLIATVVAGFPGRFQLRIDGKLEHLKTQTFIIACIDETGAQVRIDVPVTVTLGATGARLRTHQTSPWSDEVAVKIERGASESGLVEIEPTSWGYSTARLQSTARVEHDYVLDTMSMTLPTDPPWFVKLFLSIVGAVLGFGARGAAHVKKDLKNLWITVFVAVVVPGVLAYLITVIDLPIIHVQPSGWAGNVLMGLLGGYLGTDVLVRAILHDGNPTAAKAGGSHS